MHYFWGSGPLCKYEETFWNSENIQFLNFCLALPVKLGNRKIRQDSASHWHQNLNWDVEKELGHVVLALSCPLSQKGHPKIANFCSSLRSKTTL